VDVGGEIYHALNRANFRSPLFRTDAHYQDFLGIMEQALAFVPMRILAYCLMPNHWHRVLHPRADGDLARFLQRLTMTHTQRYHARTRQRVAKRAPLSLPYHGIQYGPLG